MAARPPNVGIKAIELYFPNLVSTLLSHGRFCTFDIRVPTRVVLIEVLQCVDQEELEMYDKVSPGRNTVGLGQYKMSFCDDREGLSQE